MMWVHFSYSVAGVLFLVGLGMIAYAKLPQWMSGRLQYRYEQSIQIQGYVLIATSIILFSIIAHVS
mgnify:CR=1 FL=1